MSGEAPPSKPQELKSETSDFETAKGNIDTTASERLSIPSQLDNELVDRLKRWRGKTSAALGIPAYRIISNATIERVVSQLPKSIAELESIQGIGSATIEQFGYDLMRLIQGSNPIAEKVVEAAPMPSRRKAEKQPAIPSNLATDPGPTTDVTDPGDAYWTWRLFRDGYAWQQVTLIRRRSSLDVAQDLIVAAKTGHAVQASWINGVPEAQSVLPWTTSPGANPKQSVPQILGGAQT